MHVEGKHGVDSTRFEAVQIHMMPPKLMVQIIYVRVSRKYLFGEVLNGKDLGENAGNTEQIIPQQKKKKKKAPYGSLGCTSGAETQSAQNTSARWRLHPVSLYPSAPSRSASAFPSQLITMSPGRPPQMRPKVSIDGWAVLRATEAGIWLTM